jgi:CheY-like chemotaxis protein
MLWRFAPCGGFQQMGAADLLLGAPGAAPRPGADLARARTGMLAQILSPRGWIMASRAPQGASSMTDRRINILLVDDDELDIMSVRRAFEKEKIDYPLFLAGDGLKALEVLRGGTIPRERRLVLLDINMPRMNGIEFLRELRADPELHATSVVVLTTSNEERDKIEAYDLNVAGYLLKPVRFVAFVDIMATLNRYWTLMEFP